jgi:hypothetical protein
MVNPETSTLTSLEVVEKVLQIEAEIKELEEARGTWRLALANLLGDLGTHPVGNYTVVVSLPNRWTTDGKTSFRADYPADKYPHFYFSELSTKAADTVLNKQTEGLTNKYKALGDPTIRITARKPEASNS